MARRQVKYLGFDLLKESEKAKMLLNDQPTIDPETIKIHRKKFDKGNIFTITRLLSTDLSEYKMCVTQWKYIPENGDEDMAKRFLYNHIQAMESNTLKQRKNDPPMLNTLIQQIKILINKGNLEFNEEGITRILSNVRDHDTHALIFGENAWQKNFIRFIMTKKEIQNEIKNLLSWNIGNKKYESWLENYKVVDLFAMHRCVTHDDYLSFIGSHKKRRAFIKEILGDEYDFYLINEFLNLLEGYDQRAAIEAQDDNLLSAPNLDAVQNPIDTSSSYL